MEKMEEKMEKDLPPGAGKSSIDLIDKKRFFQGLRLRAGETVLDVGCGWGYYALEASRRVGETGRVLAMDLWREGLEFLKRQTRKRPHRNMGILQADAGRGFPLAGKSVDCCLMATVLHDFVAARNAEGVLKEIRRVLKPGGRLAILEFKKKEGPPGPPLRIRLSEEQVRDLLSPYGLYPRSTLSVGAFNYLVLMGLDVQGASGRR